MSFFYFYAFQSFCCCFQEPQGVSHLCSHSPTAWCHLPPPPMTDFQAGVAAFKLSAEPKTDVL